MFEEGDRAAAEALAAAFPKRRAEAAAWTGVEARGEIRLEIVEGFAGMRRIAPGAPEWAVAVTRSDGVIVFRRDRLGFPGGPEFGVVVAHEAVHAVLNHLAGPRLPRWFEEGLCVHFAGAPYLRADHSLERLAAAGGLPAIEEADRAFLGEDARAAAIAYRLSGAAAALFLERYGHAALLRILAEGGAGAGFPERFREATGEDLASFEDALHERLTPRVPFPIFVLLENIDLTLLVAGALLLTAGYIRYRLRRTRELDRLDTMS